MSDFESFLSDQRDQATTPAAPAPVPDSFETFLQQTKAQGTLQQAQAATVANSTQPAETAAKAAPVGRQLGLPQSAVETDLPRFEQQAKTQANTALLAQNPVLASWVAANPDSARIAQDEYDKLSAIEKAWEGTKGIGYAALQGLGGSYNAAALGMNRGLGSIVQLLGPRAGAEWWWRNMISPREQAQAAFTPDRSIGAQAAATVGNLAGLLSQITFTGGGGQAAPASAGALEALTRAGKTAATSMAFPAFTASTNKAADVYQATGDQSTAIKAAVAEYLFQTAQGVVPFSAPGGLATRLASGAASGVATSEGQRAAMNLLMPAQLQQGFDPQQALFQAMTGAVMGGVMGPRGEPNYLTQIRQTYVDAVKAEQAQRDIGKVAALGQIAGQSKLREADPQAFHRFVETVSDKSNLDAVYVRPQDLQAALAQSPVNLDAALPEMKRQLGEGLLTGADVRIPVADYATHIAGTDLEKALLPHLKPAPDGMTFKEGQAFYQDAVKNMQAKAQEIAQAHVQETGLEQDRQAVHQAIEQQLVAAGSTPQAAKAQAALHEAFYTTLGERLGIKPSEALVRYPVQVTRGAQEAPAFGQALPDHVIEARMAQRLSNVDQATRDYQRLPDTLGGKLLNVDVARELSPDYLADRTRAAAVHELQPGARVVFTSGGAGAGKSTAIHGVELAKELERNSAVVYDTNMSNLASAASKIDKALAAGAQVHIIHVQREPLDALVNGVLPRAMGEEARYGSGRVVPLSEFAANHAGSAKVIQQLAERYKDNPDVTVHVIDNTHGRSGAKVADLGLVKSFDYNGIEGKLNEALQAEHAAGRISDAVYQATAGRPGVRQEPGGDVREVASRPDLEHARAGPAGEGRPGGAGREPGALAQNHPPGWDSVEGGGENRLEPGASSKGLYSPGAHTITLLQNADLSTFLHESGHHFLEVLRQVAQAPDAPAGVRSDFDTLMRHFGVQGATPEERLANWAAKTVDEQRTAHEGFARSFEKYLMEGKAPTFELQGMFSRFRSWLLNVYRSLRALDVQLTPEVRGVFDRLLASDQAIRETESARAYMPLWKTAEEAGMKPEDFKAYVQLGEDASSRALDAMQARSLADLKWASNAKSRALRELQREADGARKVVRAEVQKEVDAMPIYQLKDYLAGIKNYDPDIVAQAHGYEDAFHMEQALAAAPDRTTTVDQLTDQRMLEQYGEMLDPQAIEQAANDAVHNEARARFMATGLKVLTDSPLPANQIAKAAKQAADLAIGAKRIMELSPRSYQAAETRANRDAVAAAAKDPQAAIEAQRAAVLSNRLAKAAQDAQAEVQKGLAYLKKFDSATVAKKVGGEYMDRINELLSNYDVTNRFNTGAAMQTRAGMREWLQSEFERTGVMPEVSEGLLDFTQRRHWKELTVDEFRGLLDSVKSLEHVGREQQQVVVNGKRVELADLVDRAKQDMADLPHNPPVDLQPHLQHAQGLSKMSAAYLSMKSKVRGMDAAVVKMEQLFQWLTHGKRAGLGETRSGPFLEMFQRAGDAEGAERSMRAESAADMRRLGEQLREAGVNLNESLTVPLSRPGRGNQWYREELIAAALNVGNAGNLDKLTRGYGWTEQNLMHALDANLSKAEWQFVQGVWDAVGKYGPQIEALQKRLSGVGPKMIDAVTVRTQHGEFKGGYYPIVYDAFLDRSMEQKYARNADALFENQWARPTTSQGHTVKRTGYVGPIQLSLGVIPRHLDQVTHDLAWREAVIDMNKFLGHRVIQDEVDQVMGREYTKQFRPWLQAMANDKVFNTAGDSAWESFYRKARTNATMVGLGFRLSTMLIHGSSALSNSIGELGTKWFAKGAAEFATPERWEQAKEFMYSRSPEMANRFNEFDRNIHEAIDQINEHQRSLGPVSGTQKAVDAARRFAFYGVQALDMGSAAPTWMGAYLKGMAPQAKGGLGLSEDAAIDLANRAVRNAHGGGGVKDLSAVQRDKGVMSLATMFYSYWNHMYNRQRDIAKGFANLPQSMRQGTGTRDFGKLLARSWWYFVIPQVIHALLKPSPQDQQDDTLAGHLAHFGEEIALGFVSGVPVLRDLASAALSGRDYAISPLEQAGKAVVKATVDTTKYLKGEEPSAHAGKNAAQAAGYALGLPTGQASTAGSFLWDVYNGDAQPQDIKDWYEGVTSGRIDR